MITHSSRGYLLNLVLSIGRVVNNGVHLLAVFRIDVRKQPVAHDISLNSPGKSELALLIYEVDKACFRLADTSGSLLDSIGLGSFLGLSDSLLSGNWESKNVDSGLERIGGCRAVTFAQTWRRWDSTLVE